MEIIYCPDVARELNATQMKLQDTLKIFTKEHNVTHFISTFQHKTDRTPGTEEIGLQTQDNYIKPTDNGLGPVVIRNEWYKNEC